MKIYIVSLFIPFEGYCEPEKAFYNKTDAMKLKVKLDKKEEQYYYEGQDEELKNRYEILELDLI